VYRFPDPCITQRARAAAIAIAGAAKTHGNAGLFGLTRTSYTSLGPGYS
jgi:hypothetical protein